MPEIIELPQVYSYEAEDIPFLLCEKKRAAKDFKWTRQKSLGDSLYLACWLYVYGRPEQALQVCDFISQQAENPDVHKTLFLWGAVESCLLLAAHLERQRGNAQAAEAYLQQVVPHLRKAENWYSAEDDLEQARESAAYGRSINSKTHERNWLIALLYRLCDRIELSRWQGRDPERTAAWENELAATYARLRTLAGLTPLASN